MSKSLDLAKELAQRNAVPFAFIPGAFIFTDETPAHRFTTVVAPILDDEYCVVVTSRDFFDERLAAAVLAFVANRASALSIYEPLIVLEQFGCPEYSFDAAAALSPAAAKQFEHANDVLNKRAFVAFPIYRCELSGNESADLVDAIRHDFLPSLDWKRSPCPKVTMAYRNTRNKTGSRPALTRLSTVLYEVEELDEAEGSWIELENYSGGRCRLAWSQGRYTMQLPEQDITPMAKSVLIDRIKEFLCPHLPSK